jgi:glycosyltransferase involved in cell wall biosynthesis/membrane-associated phospholipid phosphatase
MNRNRTHVSPSPPLLVIVMGVATPLLLFAALATIVTRGEGFGWDRSIVHMLYVGQTPWPLGPTAQDKWILKALLPLLDFLSDWKTLLVIVLAAVAVHVSLARWRAVMFFVAALAISLLNPVLKWIFNRPSPFPMPGDPSFPSGHAVGSMAIAYGLAVLAARSRWRWPVTMTGFFFVAGVAIAIIADGGHWPSDVAAGWLISIAWVTALNLLVRPVTSAASDSARTIPAARSTCKRLGLYVDGPYCVVETADGPRVAPDAADFPFLTFACEVGGQFESLRLFGRARRTSDADGRLLLPAGVEMEVLPYYDHLLQFGQIARATIGTITGFWRGLSQVDAVWIFGPHPFSFLLIGLAVVRGKGIVLGVRQDSVTYFRQRLPQQRWQPALIAIQAMEAGYRGFARLTRVTVVGSEIARQYGGERPSLLSMRVSLARLEDVVPKSVERDWTGRIDLLTVGRIDKEKNPYLLVDAIAALERVRPGRYHLAWVGTGLLEEAARRRAADLGVGDRIAFHGFVPFGPGLLQQYRQAHAFVHVSLTEGIPAVVIEALASGTPVVGTDVGGVSAALEGGAAGVLVPPADLDALVAAVLRITDDRELRNRLVARGLDVARDSTLDVQAGRVARFMMATGDPAVGRREYAYLAG